MPTLNDVLAGSVQQSAQVQQIIDALKGTPNKGVPIAMVSLNDPNNYALTVQNDDPTNSRALSILKSDGTPFLTCDINGVSLGSPTTPVTLPAGSITSGSIADGTIATADLADGAVTNAKLASDTARLNLLTNGGFELWQRGLISFTTNSAWTADRWIQTLSGSDAITTIPTSAQVDAGSRYSLQSTYVKGSGTTTAIFQPIEDYYELKGRTVSFSIRVRCDTASAVRPWVYQGGGGGRIYGGVHTGGSTWQTLSVTTTVDPAASASPQVGIEFNASCIANFDNAMLVLGSVAADYSPLHPADDLSRCERYYESNAASAFHIFGTAQATSASAGYLPMRFRVVKANTPTVTSTGLSLLTAGGGGVSATFTSANISQYGTTLTISSASGLVAGNATLVFTSGPGDITAEAA